jgi:rRNA maturation RNase YbeY
MKVLFSARGVRSPDVEGPARRGIAAALKTGRVRARGELNVVWVTRKALRALGRRFRGADKFTDVISFRYDEGGAFGDLFISPVDARLNARRFGVPFQEECVRLCVHGALHLLGHRDYKPSERKRMWAVQEPIVRRVLRSSS